MDVGFSQFEYDLIGDEGLGEVYGLEDYFVGVVYVEGIVGFM